MATVTPAYVTYTTDAGVEETLTFHQVIEEDHGTSAQVTKFPVQTGFRVSNNSIRNNRSVSIQASISNVRLESAATSFKKSYADQEDSGKYGIDATGAVKSIIDWMINTGQETKVVTNLGVYYPVVFTKFKTKQKAGLVDSMNFTLSGEELVTDSALNYTAPVPLTFTPYVKGSPEEAVALEELANLGIPTDACSDISQTTYRVGEDFSITGVNGSGQPTTTTYIYKGIDPSTGEPLYEVNVDPNSIEQITDEEVTAENDPCKEKGFEDSLLGGFQEVGGCLIDETTDIVLEVVDETISTAMGELKKSIRGVIYGITDNKIGQALIHAGVGCIVRTATKNQTESNYVPGESLPTSDDIMTSAGEGLGLVEPEPEVRTLMQIVCGCKEDKSPDIDLSTLPE